MTGLEEDRQPPCVPAAAAMAKIEFGGLAVSFLEDRHRTNGALDLFTTAVQPGAGMPIPHHHESWDETVLGLSGTITWRIAGRDIAVAPGRSAFIPRGTVHGFANRSADVASFLSILTPGVLGPGFFLEAAALVNSGRADPAAMRSLMLSHGLIPSA